jgi:hypothetical protein
MVGITTCRMRNSIKLLSTVPMRPPRLDYESHGARNLKRATRWGVSGRAARAAAPMTAAPVTPGRAVTNNMAKSADDRAHKPART